MKPAGIDIRADHHEQNIVPNSQAEGIARQMKCTEIKLVNFISHKY